MQMHIGVPASPVVKIGDHVKIGTLIAEASDSFSVPIHAGISGKVAKISDITASDGKRIPAVTIESDGEMAVCDSLKAPEINSRKQLIEAIRQSGAVGLGGAGFPAHMKWNRDNMRIEELIVNGAECEPYITSDSLTMTERYDDIEFALRTLKKYFSIPKIIIAIEKNKKNAIAAMREIAEKMDGVHVCILPEIYPQGGEKVLVYHTTRKIIPSGKLPVDAGCIVANCTTIAVIGAYLKTGMPLVEKCVTVDGGAVKHPKNVIAPIGTPLEEVFAFCGGFKTPPKKVLYGGPMMGITVPDLSVPILKNTNAILALTEKEAKFPKSTACIRCGSCTNVCPLGLAPAEILRAFGKRDTERLKELSADSCMLCGCCGYSCPAKLPLVQTNALAKQLLKEEAEREGRKNG